MGKSARWQDRLSCCDIALMSSCQMERWRLHVGLTAAHNVKGDLAYHGDACYESRRPFGPTTPILGSQTDFLATKPKNMCLQASQCSAWKGKESCGKNGHVNKRAAQIATPGFDPGTSGL